MRRVVVSAAEVQGLRESRASFVKSSEPHESRRPVVQKHRRPLTPGIRFRLKSEQGGIEVFERQLKLTLLNKEGP